MAKSVKKNLLFNLVNTISGLLFPLITFPYATRVMMADGIGQVNFFTSIISYITLLSSLGIPMYAVREIARVRDKQKQMNIVALEILLLHVFLSFIGYAIVAVLCLTVAEIQVNIPLFLILSTSILFTTIGVEWFYQGIEDFQYIMIRNLIVKIIYVILLFSLVKTKEDLLIYGLLTILGTVGNNVFNFFRLRNYLYLDLSIIRSLRPLVHFIPALRIFILNLIISIYVNLNTVMLGFMKDVTSVGYFTAASKLSHILLGITTALQGVMLPRLSNLIQSNKYVEFKTLSQKVVDFIFTANMPLTVGLMIMSPTLISLFCGSAYQPATLSLIILSPIIFMIGLSGVFGIQILYPQGKENIVITATAIGAVSNVFLNLLLIPLYSHNGAAISTIIAETIVTLSMAYMGRNSLPIDAWNRHYTNSIVGSIIMGGSCLVLKLMQLDIIVEIIVIPIVGFLVYTLYLLIMRDSFLFYAIGQMKSIVNRNRCKQ